MLLISYIYVQFKLTKNLLYQFPSYQYKSPSCGIISRKILVLYAFAFLFTLLYLHFSIYASFRYSLYISFFSVLLVFSFRNTINMNIHFSFRLVSCVTDQLVDYLVVSKCSLFHFYWECKKKLTLCIGANTLRYFNLLVIRLIHDHICVYYCDVFP